MIAVCDSSIKFISPLANNCTEAVYTGPNVSVGSTECDANVNCHFNGNANGDSHGNADIYSDAKRPTDPNERREALPANYN
jgi:hypothetical protein